MARCPRVMLKRRDNWIGIGGTSFAHDFGLEIKSSSKMLEHFRFNYGGKESPMPVKSEAWQKGPRLQIQFTSNLTADKAHAAFTRAMIDDGILTERHHGPEELHWRRPWYCTFGDQMALSKVNPEKQFTCAHFLNEAFVLKAARKIRRNDLPVGTIIIDEGWQDRRGDWNLRKDRFLNMRRLVDELHDMDFKVILWWAPFLTSPDAVVLQNTEMVNANARYGRTLLDYARPESQDYIRKKLDTWFSDGKSGWNFDGVKIDFMAEAVYPSRDGNLEWRGEERLMHHLFKMVNDTIMKYKDSPGILGEAYNPFLSQYCPAFQFEERFDRNLSYIERRPAMAEAMIPGAWLAPHFTYHSDLIITYLEKVRSINAIPQLGKILAPDISPALIRRIKKILAIC